MRCLQKVYFEVKFREAEAQQRILNKNMVYKKIAHEHEVALLREGNFTDTT